MTQDILEYNSIVAPPKVKHYAVLVVWCFDVAHPHHEMVVAPGPAVGDAVSVAVAKVERERKGCAVTNVKAWPMAAGWSDR